MKPKKYENVRKRVEERTNNRGSAPKVKDEPCRIPSGYPMN